MKKGKGKAGGIHSINCPSASFRLWRDPRSPGDTRWLPALGHEEPISQRSGTFPLPLEQATGGGILPAVSTLQDQFNTGICDHPGPMVQTRTWPPLHHSSGKQSVALLRFLFCDICLEDGMNGPQNRVSRTLYVTLRKSLLASKSQGGVDGHLMATSLVLL